MGSWWARPRASRERCPSRPAQAADGRDFAFPVDDDTFHAIVERLRAAGVSEADVRGGGPGEQAHEADRVPGELGT